jgi:hypothetical protein
MELFIAWLVWFVALCAVMVSTWLLIDPDIDNTEAEERT